MAPSWAVQKAVEAIPLIGGFFGARQQNKINQREAQKGRDFAERMRNTQWQATIADMEAAGVNPAVAYSQGPNASPGGAVASPAENVVSSALQAKQMQKSLRLLDEQIKKAKHDAATAEAQSKIEGQKATFYTTELGIEDGPSIIPLNELLLAELDAARAGATNTAALAARNQALTRIAAPLANLSDRMGEFLPLLGLFTGAAGGAANLIRAFRKPTSITKNFFPLKRGGR